MTLVERLAGMGSDDLAVNIAKNLSAVLNTKRDYGFVVEIFGLADHDVYEKAKPRLDALVADMTAQIRRYEPRLSDATVGFVGRDGSMWALFRARGQVQDGRRLSFRLRWHVIFRNVEVSLEAETRSP